jgi:hypothetical protein
VVAIDPGTTQSAFLVWEDGMLEGGMLPNPELRYRLLENSFGGATLVAIEMVASYGMAVGKEVFETVRWIGRFEECARPPVRLVYRKDIKVHICGTTKAKDTNIRQALIDVYGPVGTRKNPGGCFGISGHLWSALAVAHFILSTDSPVDGNAI